MSTSPSVAQRYLAISAATFSLVFLGCSKTTPEMLTVDAGSVGPKSGSLELLGKAVVGIETHDKTGQILSSGYGFLIGNQGRVVTTAQLLAVADCHDVTVLTDSGRHTVEVVSHFEAASDLALLVLEFSADSAPQGLEFRNRVPVVGEPVWAQSSWV